MENVKITIEIELTPAQYEILRPWENMNEWLKMKCEKEIFTSLAEMVRPTPKEQVI